MAETLNNKWIQRLSRLDHAYQPIVNIHTGNTFGFEALLRCWDQGGFSSIDDVFDQAYEQGILHQVDLFLRQKAIDKFCRFKGSRHIKLFYNLDNRLFADSYDYSHGHTAQILEKHNFDLDDICFEISEKHQFHNNDDVSNTLSIYRSQGYKIAVDDCGTGFSGLQLLYYTEPDYIKIDRFFIQNMENDPRKRLVVCTIVNFAHFTGSLVLAEGVETIEEYSLCKEIGCDMVQGYFVQKPARDLARLKTRYEKIMNISKSERRNSTLKDRALISGQTHYIEPIPADCDIISVFDKFKKNTEASFFPVINRYDEPVGIIRESAFKEYIYSKFGRQLLENPAYGKDITRFISRIPMADIHSSVEKLIETYTHYNNNEGLIIIDDMKYVGILGTKSLLKLINEKNLTMAQNQNPLTKLPGNTMIHEYLSQSLADEQSFHHLIYFDFDNFKPYNDKYGFRNGDRLILMFSDMLKKLSYSANRFIGHIGGDDFFLGVRNFDSTEIMIQMERLSMQFKKSAESFYDPDTLKKGFILATDRSGISRRIPLISVSIAILTLPGNSNRRCNIEEAANIIAMLKKEAKLAHNGISMAGISDFIVPDETAGQTFPQKVIESAAAR